MFEKLFIRLTEFAQRFKGFSALAALVVLVMTILFSWAFSQGSFDLVLQNFGRLDRQQFFWLAIVALGILFLSFLVLMILAYKSTTLTRKKKGSSVVYVLVHEAGDPTALIADAEVILALPEPVRKRTSEDGAANFTVSEEYVGRKFTLNAKKSGYKDRRPLEIAVRHGAQVFIALERDATESEKSETRDTPFDFKNITIDHRNRYWLEAEKPAKNWFPFDKVCEQYFAVAEAVEGADPSFDVTVMNMAGEPVLLTAIGIEISSVTWVPYGLGRAGDIPKAERLAKGEAYEIQMPQKWGPDAFDPDEDVWIDVNTLATVQLPDPIYMQSKAPFRYTLTLRDLGEGYHVILRLWARTSCGEARSHQIAVGYHFTAWF